MVDSKVTRSNGEVLAQEFINFMENPYFLNEELYPNLYTIHKYKYKYNNLSFTIEPKVDKEQHIQKCCISRSTNTYPLEKLDVIIISTYQMIFRYGSFYKAYNSQIDYVVIRTLYLQHIYTDCRYQMYFFDGKKRLNDALGILAEVVFSSKKR
ncbi:hypothetical protein [Clostridium akagii]|uniref:hypothetical protein n=1 Tax=Clostridium akagii TaxID=91623 RepID=UPI00047B5C24|nr:hypothetical protein [Clostridium akagii]